MQLNKETRGSCLLELLEVQPASFETAAKRATSLTHYNPEPQEQGLHWRMGLKRR
jgi:hypothetical protein